MPVSLTEKCSCAPIGERLLAPDLQQHVAVAP